MTRCVSEFPHITLVKSQSKMIYKKGEQFVLPFLIGGSNIHGMVQRW